MSATYHVLPREIINHHILPWLYIIDPLSLRVTGYVLYREHDLLIKMSLATPDTYEWYLDTVILPLCGRTIRACIDNKCFGLINKLIDASYSPYEESVVDWFYANRRYLDLIPAKLLRKVGQVDLRLKEVLVSLYVLRLLEGYDRWVSKIRELFSTPETLERICTYIAQSPYDKDIIEHIDPSVWEQAKPEYEPYINCFFTVENKQIRYGDQMLTSDQFVEYCRNTPCSARRIAYSVWKDILHYNLVPPEQVYASVFGSRYLSSLFIPLLADILQDIDLCDKINNEVVERMPARYYLAFFIILDWFKENHKDRCPGLVAFQNLLERVHTKMYNPNGTLQSHDRQTLILTSCVLPKVSKLEFQQLTSATVLWLGTFLPEKLVMYEGFRTLRADEFGSEADNYRLLCKRTDLSFDDIRFLLKVL